MEDVILLKRNYSDESSCDIDRDVSECFYDPKLPKPDEHGFIRGSYHVSVIWKDD